MDLSQQPASQATQEQLNELINEIAFQKVLLSSIDDSVQNRQEAEDEVKSEIKSLEKQVRELKRSTTSAALNSHNSSASQLSETSSSNQSNPTNPSGSHTMDGTLSGTPLKANQVRDPWQSLGSGSSTPSTPNSARSMADLTSPSQMTLPSRKRSHSKHLDGGLLPFEENKSRRTSPSPYMTGPTTPYSSSGDDDFEIFEKEFFFQQQKAEENKIERERQDAELARSMQNEPQEFVPRRPPASSTPSAFDRLSGVRPQPSSSLMPSSSHLQIGQPSSSGRKLPWSQTSSSNPSSRVKSELGSMTAGIKREPPASYSSFDNVRGIKTEASSSRTMPGSFHDDSSTASDSDIEIIEPSAFHDNGRHNQTKSGSSASAYGTPKPKKERPSFSPEAQAAGNAALRRFDQAATGSALQRAMYGNQTVPPWMSPNAQASPSRMVGAPTNSTGSVYSNPQMGMANNIPGGLASQMYPPGAGNYVYPGPSLGNGSNVPGAYGSGVGGYPGAGNMQNLGPGMGSGYQYSQPGLSQGFGVDSRRIASDPLPGINQGINAYAELTESFSHPFMKEDPDHYIMNDPHKTTQELKELLENIRPDEEQEPEDREPTPEGLKESLYEHQKLSLTWMKAMEEGTNNGGILADDMGLGKTISALALMLSRPSTDRTRKTTLVVGPVALLHQWEREIRKKIKPGYRMSTHMAHGQSKKFGWDEIRNYDVVLTSYGTLGAEYRRLEKFLEKQAGNPHYDQAPMRKLFPLLGPKSLFYRVILDEAQCIKNKATGSARAACSLKSTYRWCLTGTPMMNNVGELYSLIHFLRIKPYNEYTRFQQAFGMLTRADKFKGDVKKAMKKLQALLKAILLRRNKTSLIDGKPIINLPPKIEEIQHVVLSEDEQAFYNALEGKTQLQFNRYMRAGTVGKNYSNILVLLLRLRQCCCHPHLITDFEEAGPAGVDLSIESMMELAKSLSPDVVARLLEAEGFECPVCYDGVENPSILIPCGHDTCAECLSKISDQAMLENVAAGNEAGGAYKCPTCRGKIETNKIIDYATFKKVHMPDPDAADEETASENSDSSDDDSETDSGSETESESDEDSDGDLKTFVVPDDYKTEDEDEADNGDDDDDDEIEETPRKSKSKSKSKLKSKSKKEEQRRRKFRKGKKKESKKHISIAMLKKEASKSAEGRRQYMRYLRKNWQPSAKVNKCIGLLERFQEEDHKTIVFSQFVSLLDLLQVPIDEKKWKCERYDGSMSADARNDAIMRFTDKSDCKVMLISLKAGNAGLNLVAASRVIILDPFWNPFIEMQAVDRAYRIGQQRSIEVHRVLIEKTVEDRIIELQKSKQKLVAAALDEGASKSLSRLDIRQLAFLFGVGDGQ